MLARESARQLSDLHDISEDGMLLPITCMFLLAADNPEEVTTLMKHPEQSHDLLPATAYWTPPRIQRLTAKVGLLRRRQR